MTNLTYNTILDSFEHLDLKINMLESNLLLEFNPAAVCIVELEHYYVFSLIIDYFVSIVSPAMDAITGTKGPESIGEAIGTVVGVAGVLVSGYIIHKWREYMRDQNNETFIVCNLIGVNHESTDDGDTTYNTTVIYDQFDPEAKTLHKILFQGTGRVYPDGLDLCRITLNNTVIDTGCYVMNYDGDWRFDEHFSEKFMEIQRQLSFMYTVHIWPPLTTLARPFFPADYCKYGVWMPISSVAMINIFLNTERYKVLCGAAKPQFKQEQPPYPGDPYIEYVHIPTFLKKKVELNHPNITVAFFPE